MYIGLDKDTGTEDLRATPATRQSAEQALLAFCRGEDGDADTSSANETAEASCDQGCPPGVCIGEIIERAVKEAEARGVQPDAPEFAKIFDDAVVAADLGEGVKINFVGAHRLGSPMPAGLKKLLDEAGPNLIAPPVLIGKPASQLPDDFLDVVIRDVFRYAEPLELFKSLGFMSVIDTTDSVNLPFMTKPGLGEKASSLDEELSRMQPKTSVQDKSETLVAHTDEDGEVFKAIVSALSEAVANLATESHLPVHIRSDLAEAALNLTRLAEEAFEV